MHAFVTLITTDSYLPGALTCVASLLDAEGNDPTNKKFDTVCLVTPATVGHESIKALQKAFDVVVGVEAISTSNRNSKELDLLGRADLHSALTKLHLFRLTQYSKVIFLDADTLILRPLSQLFDVPHPFSACPDSGWPDSFNSGVMILTPSEATFQELVTMMGERGSWDGADQGLLNEFFPNWNRLSFTFNATPSAYYTYAPAYRRHGPDVSVLHFIGNDKPWSRERRDTNDSALGDYYGLVNKWYDCYERHFGTSSTKEVGSRTILPPSTFKSTYIALPTAGNSRPILMPSSTPQLAEWDPSRSSPPRKSNDFQMREPMNDDYENIWDASNAKQKARFEPPKTYPSIPASTHEWYQKIMKTASDPRSVKPVFPWESKGTQNVASRVFPKDDSPRGLPSMQSNNTPTQTTIQLSQPGFQNAWDSIPGIDRYAKNLSRSKMEPKIPSVPSSPKKSRNDNGLGGRISSLVEPKSLEKGDASSRDGDDEGDSEDSEDEVDRHPINFKSRSSSMERSGSGDGKGNGSARSQNGATSPTRSKYVPLSPRSARANIVPLSEGDRTPTGRSSSNGAALGFTDVTPVPQQTQSALPHKSPVRFNPSVAPSIPITVGGRSPLATHAMLNSAAAAARAATPPASFSSMRASRVFSPETDTSTVKQLGIDALQRFVSDMENNAIPNPR